MQTSIFIGAAKIRLKIVKYVLCRPNFAPTTNPMASRLELLKKYADEDPADPFLLYGLAMETRKRKPAEAMTLFRRLRLEHPDYLPMYYQAAVLAYELSDAGECLALIEEGIAIGRAQKDAKTVAELEALGEQVREI
jgi:hypothetical protein